MKVNMQVPHQDGSTFEGTFVLIIRVHVRHVHVGFIQNKVGLLYIVIPPPKAVLYIHVRVMYVYVVVVYRTRTLECGLFFVKIKYFVPS